MDSLAERVQQDAEAWRPEPGDTLVGTVTEVGTRESEFGVYPLLGVSTEEGKEFMVHAFHTVLAREIARLRPKVDDRIALRFRGDHANGYKDYRVLVEHAQPEEAAEPDWDALERSTGEQAEWEAHVRQKEKEAAESSDDEDADLPMGPADA